MSYREYLKHILDEADFISQKMSGLDRHDFLNDEVLKRAFVRSLEIIGEATKRLPGTVREDHSSIERKTSILKFIVKSPPPSLASRVRTYLFLHEIPIQLPDVSSVVTTASAPDIREGRKRRTPGARQVCPHIDKPCRPQRRGNR